MTLSLVPIFYVLVAIVTLWLGLLSCARLKPRRRTLLVKAAIGVATAGVLLVPIDGLPLWSRAFSIYPNPSVPLLGIVCAALAQRLLGVTFFKPVDWRALWVFGAIGGTALYLHPMIFGAIDLYYWGWQRETAVWCLAMPAVVLLTFGSRLGVLLLAALIAYAVNALESQNCWDYVMDPFFWLISIAVTGKHVFAWAFRPLWATLQRRVGERAVETASAPAVAMEVAGAEAPTQIER